MYVKNIFQIKIERDLLGEDDQIVHGLGAAMEYFPEGLSELRVEYGVDDRVKKGVDVAQPRGEDEDGHAWIEGEADLIADGSQDRTGEEWCPTEEEYAWKTYLY